MDKDDIKYYNTHQESILLDSVTENNTYDSYSHASCVDWEIGKTTEAHPKKLEFNIDKSKTGLKKINFNINVNDNTINNMNDEEVVYPSDDLIKDDYSNIEDHEICYKQTNQNNSCYTLVDNKLQLSSHLEDLNETNDWKTTNIHEGELVVAYNTNAGNNTLRPKTFYALYIVLNDNSNGNLIFKLSTKYILITIKYQLIHIPEDLFEAINETDSFNNKIQVNHFSSGYFIIQDDHSDNNKDDPLVTLKYYYL